MRNSILFGIALISLIGLLITHPILSDSPNRISFLNIGQGDATLIQYQNVRILIDCGPPGGPILDRLQEQLGFLTRRIDMLIITHGDSDHYGGCQDVFEHYDIGHTMINGVNDPDNPAYTSFIEELSSKTQVLPGIAGATMSFQNLELLTLSPDPGIWGIDAQDDNEHSIALRVKSPNRSILLPGDIPMYIESQLIAHYPNLDVDILKAAHHGSKTSTSSAFLEATSPEVVIISAGDDNSFGHPHPDVVERILQREISIQETKSTKSLDFSL